MKAGGVLALDSTMDFKQLEIPTEILKSLTDIHSLLPK